MCNPAPDERIPRQRKRPNPKAIAQNSFTLLDPQHFLSSKKPVKNETCFTSPSSSIGSFLSTSLLDQDLNCDIDDLQPEHNQKRTQLLLDEPHSCCSYLTRRKPTQITMAFKVSPSVEKETADHRKTANAVFQSLSVPDDMIHLTESIFKPFGLRDSTQVATSLLYSEFRHKSHA